MNENYVYPKRIELKHEPRTEIRWSYGIPCNRIMILIQPDQTAKHAISIFEFRSGIEPIWSRFKLHLIKCSKQFIVGIHKNCVLIFKFEYLIWTDVKCPHKFLFLCRCVCILRNISNGNKNEFSIRARFKCVSILFMPCIKHINFEPTPRHKSFGPLEIGSFDWSISFDQQKNRRLNEPIDWIE